ncbi:DUF6892 domain-containing protein [Streptomyces sp. NPDC056661]|uniref:DUF6892 domain-containing protein n=1 Tax=Streptomyces sp. NPDC056661 TaxID=3345898 RepID=UPI00367423BA
MGIVEVADRNLHLALLDEVFTRRVGGRCWLSFVQQEYAAYRTSVGGAVWDELVEKLGTDRLPELERFLFTLPLTQEDLSAVTYLCLDGDREVYQLYPHWWHFGGHFTITNLDGIEYCRAVTRLFLGQGIVEGCSLAPLAELTELRYISLCALGKYRDVEALIALPALAELQVVNTAPGQGRDPWSSVLEHLRARGVAVHS